MAKIEKNVAEYLQKFALAVGSQYGDDFSRKTYLEICDKEITSPIERILFISVRALIELNCIQNLHIVPQHIIGTFRADFLVWFEKDGKLKTLLVECDSRQFHDRSEDERKKEKRRERYFVSSGYKLFRFTGSEIVRDPGKCAAEIVSYLTGLETADILTDSY